MVDGEWASVQGKKRMSVFKRLGQFNNQDSKDKQLSKILITVYVSNLSSHLYVHELWNICGCMGVVVDVFIAKKKNELGQMFAFVIFIRVGNPESLLNSLSNSRI